MDTHDRIDRSLDGALRALADDERELGASPAVRQRLEDEVRRLRTAPAADRNVVATIYALAAAVVFAALVPLWKTSSTSPTPPKAADGRGSGEASAEIATAFVPLPFSAVPFTGGQVMRLNVPRTALARVGLAPFDAADSTSAGTVAADVLVGDDGLARAVRLVQPANSVEVEQRQ